MLEEQKIIQISVTGLHETDTSYPSATIYALTDKNEIYEGSWDEEKFVWNKKPLPKLMVDNLCKPVLDRIANNEARGADGE